MDLNWKIHLTIIISAIFGLVASAVNTERWEYNYWDKLVSFFGWAAALSVLSIAFRVVWGV